MQRILVFVLKICDENIAKITTEEFEIINGDIDKATKIALERIASLKAVISDEYLVAGNNYKFEIIKSKYFTMMCTPVG